MKLSSKAIAFVGMMSAVGIVLSIIAFVPLAPGINLDISHIATFVVSVAGGPWLGALTGLIVGIYPMIQFSMNYFVPLGKALNGLVVGFLFKKIRPFFANIEKWIAFLPSRLRLLLRLPLGPAFLAIIAGWIAEAFVIYLTLGVFGMPYPLPLAVVKGILVKGTAEIVFLGIIVELLFKNEYMKHYVEKVFA